MRKKLPKYEYPDHVLTAAMLNKYGKYGINMAIQSDYCIQIAALDAQKELGKQIYGTELLSDKAAAERAAAERERMIVAALNSQC